MKKINAELSSWNDLVYARNAEINNNEDYIEYPTYNYKYNSHKINAVLVGNTPLLLKDLGFDSKIIYDLEHFKSHMLPDYQTMDGVAHGHGGTAEELLRLPKLLSNPVAIVAVDAIEKESNNDYKPVGMLFSYRNGRGEQEYKLAVVKPNDYDSSVIRNYCNGSYSDNPSRAARIVSYYDISENKFTRIMSLATENNNKNLIYFDRLAYSRIQFQNSANDKFKHVDLKEQRFVKDYSYLDKKKIVLATREHKQIGATINNVLIRYANSNYLSNVIADHPYVSQLLNVCSNGKSHNLNETVFAYMTCCNLARNYSDEPKMITNKLTTDFLASYDSALKRQNMAELLSPYMSLMEDLKFSGNSEYDEEAIYSMAEEIEGTLPTLKNLNISEDDPRVTPDMIEVSKSIESAGKMALNEAIDMKLEKLEMSYDYDSISIT